LFINVAWTKSTCVLALKKTPNYTWYVMYTLHIHNHLKIWSFDHIKVVANWTSHKSLYVSWFFVYILTIWSGWKSWNVSLKLYIAKKYNNYKYFKHYNNFCLKWVDSSVFLPFIWHFDLCKLTRFNYMCDYINFINDIFV
jgi:hypothetical protein